MTVPNGRRLAATDDIGVTSAEQWRGAITAPSIAIGPGRLVVVAPHPDDEVLGLGATMAARSSRKAPDLFSGRGPGETGATDTSTHDPSDVVVCVSDGAASHPGEVAPEEMRGRRKAECEAGAREVGIDLRMLGLPDGGLSADAVDAALHPVLDELAPTTVAVTWSGDGHPDHHVCAESVRRWWRDARARGRGGNGDAAGDGGGDGDGDGDGDVTLLEFPVWMWHWASPGDADVPWERLRRVAADDRAFDHKRRALAAHASQLEPQSSAPDATVILPPAVVERFFLGAEWVFA